MVGETIKQRLRTARHLCPSRSPVSIAPYVQLDEGQWEWYIATFSQSSPRMKAYYIQSLGYLTKRPTAEVAAKLRISKSTAYKLRALLYLLPEEVLKDLDQGRISASAGYALARLQEPEKQVALAREVAAVRTKW